MALIDRNFQGFGKELFTDAGKYVLHFGDKPMEAASQASKTIQAAHPDKPAPPVTAVAKYRNPDMQIIATSTADQLVSPSNMSQPLADTKRTLCLYGLAYYAAWCANMSRVWVAGNKAVLVAYAAVGSMLLQGDQQSGV